MLFNFASPGKDNWLASLSVSGPLGAAGRVLASGCFREKSAAEGKIDSGAWNFHGHAGNAGKCCRERDSFFAGSRGDGNRNRQSDYGAASMREQRGKLTAVLRIGMRSEGQRLAVPTWLAAKKTRGGWHS